MIAFFKWSRFLTAQPSIYAKSLIRWQHRALSSAAKQNTCTVLSLENQNKLLTIHRPISFSIKDAVSISPLTTIHQIKKRPLKKKQPGTGDVQGYFNVIAYATAEEYDLESLRDSLIKQDLYELQALQPIEENATDIKDTHPPDFLYATAKIKFGDEPRDIFFFREGSVVLWNCPELECSNVLAHLKQFEIDAYNPALIAEESDCMAYNYHPKRAHLANGNFYLSQQEPDGGATGVIELEKYTYSNALSTSVKLGIWEALLDRYVDSMAYVTDDLKRGTKIKMSRAEVLRKTGELFALRHLINLSSDLLDTPDFYWDREQLEHLYSSICGYFSVQRRTKV